MFIKNNYNNNLGGTEGVAIILRDKIKAEIMNDIVADGADIDYAAVQVSFLKKKIDIIAIHRRPGKQTKRKTWINIINKSRVSNSIIMAGDFNAHHII